MKINIDMVSIAMCTYNGEAFIGKQIQSILDQTHSNIELVIVDDKSSDRTIDIIETLKAKDKRIRLHQNQKNIGFNKNFEKAIRLCSGDFIAISDQDDIWLPNKIERLLASLGNNFMVYANSAKIDDDNNFLGSSILESDRHPKQYNNYKNILINNFVTGHNVLFKKQAVDLILPFPDKGFYDWWMGFVMLYEGKLAYCNEILTHYRIHNQSVIKVIQSQLASSKEVTFVSTVNTNMQELKNFQQYRGLNKNDRDFLSALESAIKDKLYCYFSFRLYKLLWNNFELIFPGYNKPTIKKVFFLYRNCRGIKWPWLFRSFKPQSKDIVNNQ